MTPKSPMNMIAGRRRFLQTASALTAATASGLWLPAQADAGVIRYGAPDWTLRDNVYWGIPGIARAKGWIQEEFARDGVRIEYVGFKGGAPAVGQALANGQIDIAGQGDLLSIIGRASGLNTRIVFPLDKLVNANLAVPVNSTVAQVADLRGKRVAYNKGNQIHLQVLRILANAGLSERDIRSIYLDPAAATAALASGDVDAVFGSMELYALRDSGVAKIVYSTRGQSAALTSYNALVVRSEFAERHGDWLGRFVRVLVRAAYWASQPANRDEVLKIWGSGPVRMARYFSEEYADRPWTDRLSPLLDPLFVQHYEQTQQQIARLGLLRGKPFDTRQWIDPSFLQAALAQEKLERYWSPLPALAVSAAVDAPA